MLPFSPDWSLERKSLVDQKRHQAKIEEALSENLGELITEESVLTTDRGQWVRIPIQTLEQYKFRFHPTKGERVAQAHGEEVWGDDEGDVRPRSFRGGEQPGEFPGEAVYEAEVPVEAIHRALFGSLGLPALREKPEARLSAPQWIFKDVTKKGLMGNLDRRRTLRENLLRHARTGQSGIGSFVEDDMRFRTWDQIEETQHNAVVIAMRDISGSMGDFKKQMARLFAFWMLQFLRSRYRSVEVVFLVHHTSAREVSEEDFFHLGESGGTKVSSVYELCRDVITTRYPPQRWNLYPIHFSDGDNWSDADNRRTAAFLNQILPWTNQFGYAEIREGRYASTLMSQFSLIRHPRFKILQIASRSDVYPALQTLFPRDGSPKMRGEADA